MCHCITFSPPEGHPRGHIVAHIELLLPLKGNTSERPVNWCHNTPTHPTHCFLWEPTHRHRRASRQMNFSELLLDIFCHIHSPACRTSSVSSCVRAASSVCATGVNDVTRPSCVALDVYIFFLLAPSQFEPEPLNSTKTVSLNLSNENKLRTKGLSKSNMKYHLRFDGCLMSLDGEQKSASLQ